MTESMEKYGFNESMINNLSPDELSRMHQDDPDFTVRKMASLIGTDTDEVENLREELDSVKSNYHHANEELQESEEAYNALETEHKKLKDDHQRLEAEHTQLKEKVRAVGGNLADLAA